MPNNQFALASARQIAEAEFELGRVQRIKSNIQITDAINPTNPATAIATK